MVSRDGAGGGTSRSTGLLVVMASYWIYTMTPSSLSNTYYRASSAVRGLYDLLNVPASDMQRCVESYEYFMNGTRNSNTEEETQMVRNYYTVLNRLLAIVDIEKMYIPPQLDPKENLFENQLLIERDIFRELQLESPEQTRLLDIGCGRGRISHHAATFTGGRVSGFNIDEDQVQFAKDYANETNFNDRLDFKIGDHHKHFDYPDESFDGSYSFQAVWPFFKVSELDHPAEEIYRVLKPGGYYACSEYLLAPEFDWNNEEHVKLHTLWMPTLAATQSNYPTDITAAFERAGFEIVKSVPSKAPAWPLTDQKTDTILAFRAVIRGFVKFGLVPDWVEKMLSNLLLGGQAWAEGEKMKIGDLNWKIVVRKPLN